MTDFFPDSMRDMHIPAIQNVLIVAKDEGKARADRTQLRRMCAQDAAYLDSGVKAARYMQQHPVDLVLCDEELADMSGLEFIRLVRANPGFAGVPVVMASTQNTDTAVRQAFEAGGMGYLIRPYSLKALHGQASQAVDLAEQSLWRRPQDASTSDEAFETALLHKAADTMPTEPTPAALSRMHTTRGFAQLKAGKRQAAITSFSKALREDINSPEPFEGLGKVYQALRRRDKHIRCMLKATELYARQGRYAAAREVFEELKAANPTVKNPCQERAFTSLLREDYKGAAESWTRALQMVPPDSTGADVYAHITRACHFTDNPEESARRISTELQRTGVTAEADLLFNRIMGPEYSERISAAGRSRLRKSTSLLGDMLAVARFTFQAYRTSGERAEPEELAWGEIPLLEEGA